jgi:hypothetical protein
MVSAVAAALRVPPAPTASPASTSTTPALPVRIAGNIRVGRRIVVELPERSVESLSRVLVDLADEGDLDVVLHGVVLGVVDARGRREHMPVVRRLDADRSVSEMGLAGELGGSYRRVDYGVVFWSNAGFACALAAIGEDWAWAGQ